MTIDASKLEGWASAMQVAKNGLGWYRNEFPEAYNASDYEAHAQLDEALASMAEELEVARGEVMVNGLNGAETSASASVAGLTCGKDHAADVAAASADDMKVYDGIAADTIEHHPENVAAKQDTAALNWIERQHLEELGMGLVIDAPNDGKYYVCGDSGTTHYGKTLREAVASAIAEGV